MEPGIAGWVKAKMNGTRQLVDVVTGHLPDADRAARPRGAAQGGRHLPEVPLARRPGVRGPAHEDAFTEDEKNSREFVGLMIRPGGGDAFDVDRSVHWHVLSEFSYSRRTSTPRRSTTSTATRDDGTMVEYIARNKINNAENVRPDIDALKAVDRNVTLSCYDCHNRVGHDIQNPRADLDYQLSTGAIDPSLPYIKREGMRILWTGYPDDATADAEIDKLGDFYKLNYPDVYATKGAQIEAAIDRAQGALPPDHDARDEGHGGHLPEPHGPPGLPGLLPLPRRRPLQGRERRRHEARPSRRPATPATRSRRSGRPWPACRWASRRARTPTTPCGCSTTRPSRRRVDPGGQSCGECHARDYCVNCHSTGAVTIDHDTMATNHAQVIREQGTQSCAYCHQPVYCARCHVEPVLPVTSPAAAGRRRAGARNRPPDWRFRWHRRAEVEAESPRSLRLRSPGCEPGSPSAAAGLESGPRDSTYARPVATRSGRA